MSIKVLVPLLGQVVALQWAPNFLFLSLRNDKIVSFQEDQLAANRHRRNAEPLAHLFDGKPAPILLQEFQGSLLA